MCWLKLAERTTRSNWLKYVVTQGLTKTKCVDFLRATPSTVKVAFNIKRGVTITIHNSINLGNAGGSTASCKYVYNIQIYIRC